MQSHRMHSLLPVSGYVMCLCHVLHTSRDTPPPPPTASHIHRPDITYPYQLMAGFPSAPISDEDATLEAAGLLNAVIIQKK